MTTTHFQFKFSATTEENDNHYQFQSENNFVNFVGMHFVDGKSWFDYHDYFDVDFEN